MTNVTALCGTLNTASGLFAVVGTEETPSATATATVCNCNLA